MGKILGRLQDRLGYFGKVLCKIMRSLDPTPKSYSNESKTLQTEPKRLSKQPKRWGQIPKA